MFWEVTTRCINNQELGKSFKTKDIISVGTHSNQIWEKRDDLTCWAKACATELPCRPTWVKEILWKEFECDRISLMRYPPRELSMPIPFKALTIDSELPSQTHWAWLDFVVNVTGNKVISPNLIKKYSLIRFLIVSQHWCRTSCRSKFC